MESSMVFPLSVARLASMAYLIDVVESRLPGRVGFAAIFMGQRFSSGNIIAPSDGIAVGRMSFSRTMRTRIAGASDLRESHASESTKRDIMSCLT